MSTAELFKERFDQLQSENGHNGLGSLRQRAFHDFTKWGIPTAKHEEWKYTRIGNLFNKEYSLPATRAILELTARDLDAYRLPGFEEANELVFVNGLFSMALSTIRSADLVVLPLDEAAKGGYKETVSTYLGHSNQYLKDSLTALNTAFIQGGVFIHVPKGKAPEHPVYIYHISDARTGNMLSQPRNLVHIGQNARLQVVETNRTLGESDSFTNQVMEMVVEKDALVEYYKIQDDVSRSGQVSTSHIRQIGKSHVHTVTISLNGGMVRNNLNILLEAEHCEAHLYGLYFPSGQGHIDNHTVVDNIKPHCFSNEFYKGIMDDSATGVFNGKIYVRQQAQKTNAYQSNKNILLTDTATVNTKPQLEIFADDVKCSHGCTIGQLDEEGLFYLRSRGIRESAARALLLHAFAIDILEHIQLAPIRAYVDRLIAERLEFDIK